MTSDPKVRVGVLVSNLGSPEAPTRKAVKKFLAEFLWDQRVIDLPRLFWWPILHGIILNTRPQKVAPLYQKIWGPGGSPLKVFTNELAAAIEKNLPQDIFSVAVGMRYGEPSLSNAILSLKKRGCKKILALPLYPQFSSTTTGSTFGALSALLHNRRDTVPLRYVDHYFDNKSYIQAVANSIQCFWQTSSRPDKLLFSFHGLPLRYVGEGDPYPTQCEKTARLVAEHLGLVPEDWSLCYQSRFGREEWLSPDLPDTLKKMAQRGHKNVQVICPGFAVDGLETLEEVALRNREVFLAAGGTAYEYIPALNVSEEHAIFLAGLVKSHAEGWL